jgi:hypothetical protein
VASVAVGQGCGAIRWCPDRLAACRPSYPSKRMRGGGLLHLVEEVAARPDIPGLQHGGVAGGLQLHGDPLGPGPFDRGIADEEVSR